MTPQEARKYFHHLNTEQVYFNHASIGVLSSLTVQKLNEYIEDRHYKEINNYDKFLQTSAEAKIKLGKLLNAPTDRIAWTDNVSNSLNILAQGLNWKTGDRIILNNIEFPANVYPFLNLIQHGVEIDFVQATNGQVLFDDIEKLVTPKTKLLSISLVQFLTGFKADVDVIGNLCKEKDIIFCVDAIQGAGVVQIDVQKSKIDFITGGTQKWLNGLEGLSYVYLTDELQSRINQKNVGWLAVEDAWNFLDYKLLLKKDATRFENGTICSIGVVALNSSLDLFELVGYSTIEEKIIDNTKHFIKSLLEIGIEPIQNNFNEKNLSGIVSIRPAEPQKYFEELTKKKVMCSLREGLIRFSPHYYNTKDEIEKVVDILHKLL